MFYTARHKSCNKVSKYIIMNKIFVPLFVFVFLVGILRAQNIKQPFLEKTNQSSIGADAISLSFSYAYKFNKKAIFGFQAQFGAGIRFLLNNPTFNHLSDQSDESHKCKVKTVTNSYIEMLKFQLFYRLPISKSFYLDVGPHASWGIGSFDARVGGRSLGIELSGYYTRSIFFMGLRFQGSYIFIEYRENFDNNYFGLFLTPVVLGLNF